MTLTELSIKRPSFIIVIFLTLTIVGLYCYQQLNYELLPKMTPPVITIATPYPGASPDEVEQSVTRKIEDAISSLENINQISAQSNENLSFVIIEFKASTDIDKTLQEAQRKVNGILNDLPKDAKIPTVFKFAMDEMPIIRLGLTSSKLNERQFYQLVKDQIKPQLSKIEGVAQVTLVGGSEREIRVSLDAQKLRAYGLPLGLVVQTISSQNLDFPTGNLKSDADQYVVRIAGKLATLDELRNLVVGKSRTGGDVRLSDVGEVVDTEKEPTNINRINGVNSIGVFVQKQSDANAVSVSRLTRKALKELEEQYKEIGLKVDLASDSSEYTIASADAVKFDLLLAIGLVAIVMLFFLHSLKSALIVMVALPTSMISTFGAMYLFGFSLNLMTLLALSLVVGILVDDSIVVLENIFRHLEMGKSSRQAALDGRNEIGFTALSITLVDVVVFLPLAMVGGIIGNIMREFALVVVVSTLLSLFVSFTLTPMLASRFSKLEPLTKGTLMGRFGLWFEGLFNAFTREYLTILKGSLKNIWTQLFVAVATVVLLVSSFALVGNGFIGGEFVAVADRGEFGVLIELPSGVSLQETNRRSRDIEAMLTKLPGVVKVSTNVGASSDGFLTNSSNNIADIYVTLVPMKERKVSTDDVMKQTRDMLNKVPGVKAEVRALGIFGGANETPIQIQVSGITKENARKAAEQVLAIVQKTDGTLDQKLSSKEGKPEVRVEVDKQRMAQFGLTVQDVGMALRIALTGFDQSKFSEASADHIIRIQLDAFDRQSVEDVGKLMLMNNRGQQVELKQFCTIYQSAGPTKLERFDRNTSVMVQSQVMGRPAGDVGNDIKAQIAKLENSKGFPPGTSVSYIGQMKNTADSFSSMGIAIMAGILFVYLIMVALYDSFVYPFVVLFSIPVAVVGALLALALTMNNLSVFTMLGMIMLIGLVGKNAILLVDFANAGRAEGLSIKEALMEAGRERLRPILMTTLAMIFGMLPIALATGAGSEWKRGLAWCLVGGLTSSMFLTLVFVPVMYYWTASVVGALSRLLGLDKPTEEFHEHSLVGAHAAGFQQYEQQNTASAAPAHATEPAAQGTVSKKSSEPVVVYPENLPSSN